MKGLFIPEITAEMFRNGCFESIEALMAEGKIYDIDYQQPCEDCISRQATIDAIYKKHIGGKDAIENAPINDLYACGLEEAVDAVENMPPVTPWFDWIPVSEKLPDSLTAVLLTVRYKSSGCLTYQMGYWEDTLEKWEKWLEIGILDDEFEILAWMELPEKYEEGEDE